MSYCSPQRNPYPNTPCMDYLPTLGETWPLSKEIVGRYSLHFVHLGYRFPASKPIRSVDFRALDLPLLTMPRRATRPMKPATARDAVAMPASTTHQTCYLYQKTFSQVANKESTIVKFGFWATILFRTR